MTVSYYSSFSPAGRVTIILLTLALPATAALRAGQIPWPTTQESSPNTAHRYPLKGVVVEVHADDGKLLVKHEDIPGFMPGMTMLFRADATALKELRQGDRITATLVVRDDEFWLEQVKIINR